MSPAEAKAHAAEYGERSRGGMTKIALMRMGRGLTQADVAARMHVSPQTYADIERGRKGVKVATLQRVAQALEVPTADLID
jgi:transcriptional regulator with XRE-family HTH domain